MNDDDKFLQLGTLLDRAADEIDAATSIRLRAARRHAVAAAERRRERSAWWLPLSGAVTAGLVAVALAFFWWSTMDPMMTAAEDVEWLTAKESPDLFSEQLEFYHWLDDESDAS